MEPQPSAPRFKSTKMNPTKRSKLEDLETIRRAQAQHEDLSVEARVQLDLTLLQAFIAQLARTPNGKADIARRTRAFGPCLPLAGENSRQYYGRLRCWLDSDC